MNHLQEDLEIFLNQQKKEQTLRTLNPISNSKIIDFSTNDYLGLSKHPKLIATLQKETSKLGIGSTGSRLLSGDHKIFHQLEEEIAQFKQKEAGLILNSGYQANVGLIPALCSNDTTIFYDRLCHASLIDGILLSRSPSFRFKHNDLMHLETLLKKNRSKFKKACIITESIFSMDGDQALLKELVSLKKKYDCWMMVDEAHATGIYGKTGAGLIEELGLSNQIELILGTFSKALGSFGAYIATTQMIKKYLINTCRSFIYSTSLPLPIIAVNRESLKIIQQEPFRRSELLKNANFLRESLKKIGLTILGNSQIIPILIGDNQKTIDLSKKLLEKKFRIPPIRYPTVPKNTARLRISVSYLHSMKQLKNVIEQISKLTAKLE